MNSDDDRTALIHLYVGADERLNTRRFTGVSLEGIYRLWSPYVDWKPRPDIAWRLEVDNAIHRSFKRELEQFTGARDISGLDFIQERSERPARVISLRLRKLFGG